MKVVVIGGSGHIGSFLVPRLVRAGHEVCVITRGGRSPYVEASEWRDVRREEADRAQLDAEGTFGQSVLALGPDVVIDLVCFTRESAAALVDALRGRVAHLLHCGSIWRHGTSLRLPIAEDGAGAEPPFGEHGIQKAAIAQLLKDETAAGGLVTTSIHPGHIVGPGWQPVGPLGNFNPSVWTRLSAGETLHAPGNGTETMHHVHADDVAQLFERAMTQREAAAGEDFTAVAPSALSVRGYVTIASGWFGLEPRLEQVSWDEFHERAGQEHGDASWGHLHRSQVMSIDKARTLLGYEPAYEPDAAVLESLRWLIQHEQVEVRRPLVV